MHKFPPLLLLFSAVCAFAAAPKKVDLGTIDTVVDNAAIAVRVTANSPELQTLAQTALNSHGRYKVVGGGQHYDIKFTALAPTQVRVDITKGREGAAFASQVVTGTSARHALLRAADVAVEKTNGLNLRGFFTARLTFLSQRTGKSEVYASDLFPGPAQQVTHDRALIMTPRWSPDGSRIIYTSYFKTGAPDIYLHDPSTGRRDIFANFQGTNMGARFSPNGRQVAMTLTTKEGATEIFVKDVQGGQPVRKTRSDIVKSSPCFSPDGSQIVFVMDPGPQLYVMPAAGGSPRRLPLTAAGLGTYAAEPDWSRANPNKIACTVRVGRQYQIAVFDIANNTGKIVSKAEFDGLEPSWLGDGRHLVYTARNRTSSVLAILDTETGKSTRITGPEIAALQANVWTP